MPIYAPPTMSSSAIGDYLMKQLFISKTIVTYRSLSREFGIHVNEAKKELAAFYTTSLKAGSQPAVATYLISGDVHSKDRQNGGVTQDHHVDAMDVDEDEGTEDEDEDEYDVPITRVLLVSQASLDSTKSQFSRVHFIHVYGLSAASLRDAGLICTPTPLVREKDAKNGADFAMAVGKVISADVRLKTGKRTAAISSSTPPKVPMKPTAPSGTKIASSSSEEEKTEDKAEQAKTAPAKPQLKATGKLDWRKAKVSKKEESSNTAPTAAKKDEQKKAVNKEELPQKTEPKETKKMTVKKEEKGASIPPKRGVKRKSTSAVFSSESDDDAEPLPPKIASAPKPIKSKKNILYSEEEDEDAPTAPKENKKTKSKAEAERSLREMMDIDDDDADLQRILHSHPATSTEPSPSGRSALLSEEEEEKEAPAPVSAPKPARKRKEKKAVPLGRNGLKKRRVMKSRTDFDEKGYMVTQDYSSYESVSEEEAEAPPESGSSKPKKSSSTQKVKATESVEKPKRSGFKPGGRTGGEKKSSEKKNVGQQNLGSFFSRSRSTGGGNR